jgi:hypothetical protein
MPGAGTSYTIAAYNALPDMPAHVRLIPQSCISLMPLPHSVHALADGVSFQTRYMPFLLFPESSPCPHTVLLLLLRLSPFIPDIYSYHLVQHINRRISLLPGFLHTCKN